MQRLLTISGVGGCLAISEQAVHAMIRCGEPPAMQVGRGLWRVPEQSLEEYVQAGLERTARMVADNVAHAPRVTE